MNVASLKANRREKTGTGFCRKLRERGDLPGVIYGHGEDPEHIAFSAHDFVLHLHHGARVLHVDVDGKKGDYLIKDVQYDYLDKDPIHVDFARVDLSEKVTVEVAVEIKGIAKGIADGGVLDHVLDTITVECKASDIPGTLHVSVANLGIDDDLCVKDLEFPDGVTSLTDPDEKIAICRTLTEKPEEEEAEEGAESSEPEVIGKKAEDEESSE